MIMKWLNFNSIIGMAVLSLLFYTENVAAQTDKNDTKQKIDTIDQLDYKENMANMTNVFTVFVKDGIHLYLHTTKYNMRVTWECSRSEPVGITEKEISGKRICSSASYPNMTPIGLR